MGTGLASIRHGDGAVQAEGAVREFLSRWQSGEPDLESFWSGLDDGGENVSVLAALVKADLQYRYDRGDRPTAASYFERFPALGKHSERVLSLVYEEFCLREERGEQPDPGEFCLRYQSWTDSLASQLRYHRALSQAAGIIPAPPQFPLPGERFRQFHLQHELGRGGAARVYRARDESLGDRVVALKISADRGSEPAILGRLQHPHIVDVHTVVYQPETRLRGLCMPYRAGPPLDEVIRRLKPAEIPPRTARALWNAVRNPAADPPGTAAPLECEPVEPSGTWWQGYPIRGTYADGVAHIAATLARALHYAHAQRIHHRDVKPANVLLTYEHGPQLLDFNLAHDPHSAEQAEAALRGGTLPYMAPEQLRAFLDPQQWDAVGAAADIYALGLVIREMLTGKLPPGPDPGLPLPRAICALLDQRLAEPFSLVPDGARRSGVPNALQAIVARCLTANPANRYPDAAALADDLESFVRRRPLPHTANPSRTERLANWTRRNVLTLVNVFILLAASGTVVSWKYDHFVHHPEQWREMRAVIARLDAGKAASALPLIEALVDEAPDNAVIAFHRAVVFDQLKRVSESSSALSQALSKPSAQDNLLAWGKTHPRFPTYAEELGTDILEARLESKDDVARHDPKTLELATECFQLALALDPGHQRARAGLATVYEDRGEYDRALALLTELIDESIAREPASDDSLKWLHDRLISRARVEAKWARAIVDTGKTSNELNRAGSLCRAAISDYDRYAATVPDKGPGSKSLAWINYIRCNALLTLGMLAERRAQADEALQYFQKSSELLAPLASVFESSSKFREFQQEVEGKLQDARRASPPPKPAGNHGTNATPQGADSGPTLP